MEQIQFLLWTQTWQIALLFVLIWVVNRFVRERFPHFAMVLWVLFFVKCLVPPVVLAPIGMFAWQTPVAATPTAHSTTPSEARLATVGQASEHELLNENPIQRGFYLHASSRNLFWVWSFGSAGFLLLTALYFVRVRQNLLANQRTLPATYAELGGKIYSTMGLDLKNRLVVTTMPAGPLVFGFFRPVIVMPARILDSPELVRSVLAHEACHIWRRDHWLGALQMIVQTVFWFHPMVWLASRETNRLCEVCCDDDTLRLFGLPNNEYAGGLLDMLDYQRQLTAVHWVPGVRPIEITKERIQRILSGDCRVQFRRRLFVVAFLMALLIFPAGGTRQWAIGFQRIDVSSLAGASESSWGDAMVEDPISVGKRRQEMQFLIGEWSVQNEAGQEIGRSVFSLERSGNMIREDWTSTDGQTAQGITYFDPNQKCWVLTWVDGTGTIVDSKGRWSNDRLRLEGIATRSDGETYLVQSALVRESDRRIRMEMFLNADGELKQLSKIFYCR